MGTLDAEITTVDEALGTALDFDVLRGGAWAGVFRQGSVPLVATSMGQRFRLPRVMRHPLVRFVDRERLVVVDARPPSRSPAGYVFSVAGTPLNVFHAGEGIEDVVVLRDLFAITYGDEGASSGGPPSDQGIAFFDHQGRFSAGYRALFGAAGADVAGCSAACRVDASTLAFSSHGRAPLVHATPGRPAQRAHALPAELHGPAALSMQDATALLYSPIGKKGFIFRWREGQPPQEVGRHPGPLRGLELGRFLAIGRHGFTVVRC